MLPTLMDINLPAYAAPELDMLLLQKYFVC